MGIELFKKTAERGRLSRKRRIVKLLCAAIVLSCSAATAQESPAPSPAASGEVEAGKKIYEKWCINCHGTEGQGDGPAADFLRPRPRDFTRGLFKIRSTPSGKLPTDQDLITVISNGMPGTAMPAWGKKFNEKELSQLVAFVKTFSRRFARAQEAPKPVAIGNRVASSADSIAKGKQLFHDMECFKCHGEEGRANGPSAPELTDDWGYPIRPANLTKPWNFRGGHAPEDLYKRLQSGVSGTPMPSFADSLDNEKTWHLINYVMSLWPDPSGNMPPLKLVVRARRAEKDLPGSPDDPFWSSQEKFVYPLVGQVIKEPRMFTPSVNSIQVQAAYNEREIAFRLVWDDPTASQPDRAAGIFEDAVAVQLPVQIPTGAKRPYFLMGDSDLAVELLRWDSATGAASAVNGNGLANLTPQSAADQEDQAVSQYKNGQYNVVIKRPLTTNDKARDIQFEPGRFIPIGFFVWDGSNGETGGKMAISHWYYLLLEPPLSKTIYVYPAVAVVATGALQWWMIRRLRKKST